MIILVQRIDFLLPIFCEIFKRRTGARIIHCNEIRLGPGLHSDQRDVDVQRLVQLQKQPYCTNVIVTPDVNNRSCA